MDAQFSSLRRYGAHSEIEIVVPVLFFGFGFVWIMVNQVDLTYLIRLIV